MLLGRTSHITMRFGQRGSKKSENLPHWDVAMGKEGKRRVIHPHYDEAWAGKENEESEPPTNQENSGQGETSRCTICPNQVPTSPNQVPTSPTKPSTSPNKLHSKSIVLD